MKLNKNILLFISLLALVVIIFLVLNYLFFRKGTYDGNERIIPTESEFDAKIVYTTDMDYPIGPLKEDCDKRGGIFNECGSICAPEADVCVEVCAYTCELEEEIKEGWNKYENYDLGFNINHPDYMEIVEGEKFATFIYYGPTQTEGTELFDGISFAVRKNDKSSNITLREYAQSVAGANPEVSEIIEEVEEKKVAGQDGYSFAKRGLGIFYYTIIPISDAEVLEISYSVPDPNNEGYKQAVEDMLRSLVIR